MRRCFQRQAFLSPGDLLLRAIMLAACFGLVHMLGWREHTCFLSGTLCIAGEPSRWTLFMGMLYLFFFAAFTLLTPILLIAAALAKAGALLFRASGPPAKPPAS